MKQYAGVLILKNNRTYGRVKKQNGKEGKLLYKCVPNDPNIPQILIPYEMKEIGFLKVFDNIYIIFEIDETLINEILIDKNTKNIGSMTQNLGSVDNLNNFFEYQLYCKNLHNSIQSFNKETIKQVRELKEPDIKQLFMDKYSSINDRTREQVFSIDPTGCCDFDDAFSVKIIDSSNILLSIYISNVSIWLDYLNLFDSFSQRISTIYLPDRKISMLPSILSDCLCSLKENYDRIAFVMDITLNNKYENNNKYEIMDIKYSNAVINVYKNYVYDSIELNKDKNYILLIDTVKKLHTIYPLISNISDSHYLVEYLMVFMNCYSGKEMMKYNNGIFRSLKTKEPINGLPDELVLFNNTGGIYVDYNKEKLVYHELLKMDSYIHITSPIRRIVDLLNIIQLQINIGLIELNKKASIFLFNWLNELEYINNNMKTIKRLQNECNILYTVTNNPEVINEIYDAIVTDMIEKNGIYCYNCYISKLKLFSRLKTREIFNEYQNINIKLYLFDNEAKYKKKIRAELIVWKVI